MKVVWLENSIIRVGILADRGSDIFEFRYKPLDMNLLLNLPGRLRNVTSDFSQMRNTPNQFEDHYYGGWQEILPNSAAFTYKRASLGQHGEVSLIPWTCDVLERGPEVVSVRLSCTPVRFPIRIEKTITLRAGSSMIEIDEKLVSLSSEELDIMWGHHIAFGLPFIEDDLEITTNATHFIAEPEMPDNRRFEPGVEYPWPTGKSPQGSALDASRIEGVSGPSYSELAYLGGYDDMAGYELYNKTLDLGFQVNWDGSVFKNLWLWEERRATKEFPWWGNCYTVALEPWTSKWTSSPDDAIANNEWLKLKPDQVITTSLTAGITSRNKLNNNA